MSYVRSATSGGPQTGHVDIGFRLRRLSRPKSQVALSPFASAEGTHLYPSLCLPFLVAAGFCLTPHGGRQNAFNHFKSALKKHMHTNEVLHG